MTLIIHTLIMVKGETTDLVVTLKYGFIGIC